MATTEAYNRAKRRLPAVTFAGVFGSTRGKTHLVQHSGLVHGDLDHLDDVPQVKQSLSRDPSAAYCFVSPSGDGLKLGVLVTPVTTDDAYKRAWQVVSDSFAQRHGLTWDASGKDICRLCFLSWDADLFINSAPMMFIISPPTHPPDPPSSTSPRDPVELCPFTARADGVQQAPGRE